AGELIESRPWKTGRRLFVEATHNREVVPLIFSAAETESSVGLIWWARVRQIEIDGSTTRCRYDRLQAITPPLPISTLIVQSTGKPLPASDIRPYRICITPDFLKPM